MPPSSDRTAALLASMLISLTDPTVYTVFALFFSFSRIAWGSHSCLLSYLTDGCAMQGWLHGAKRLSILQYQYRPPTRSDYMGPQQHGTPFNSLQDTAIAYPKPL